MATASLFLFIFTRLDGIPRSTPLIFAMVLGMLLAVGRGFYRFATGATQDRKAAAISRPDQLRNFVVVGVDRFSALFVKLVASQTPPTSRVVALLDESPKLIGRSVNGVRVVANAHDLASVLDEYSHHGVRIDQVLINQTGEFPSEAALSVILADCSQHGVECTSLAAALNLSDAALPDYIVKDHVVEATATGPTIAISRYLVAKRFFDLAAAVVLLFATLPIAFVAALFVLIDLGTPLVFWQERLGRNGRRFLMYKFRTFKAPYDWSGNHVPAEERVSVIGKFLRATRFDEIPQILNILLGDMSLVGPRPLLPKDQPDDTSIRLLARPGITGWAQINGGNIVTPEEKEALDAWYVSHASLLLDIKILLMSLVIAVKGERYDVEAISEAKAWRQSHTSAPRPICEVERGAISPSA